jgi:hypothetical protein
MIEAMLTTTDNPHDPFDDFVEWLAFDTRAGHGTLAYLARIVVTSDETSDSDYNLAIEAGIDEIVDMNINGLYKKVTRETVESEI